MTFTRVNNKELTCISETTVKDIEEKTIQNSPKGKKSNYATLFKSNLIGNLLATNSTLHGIPSIFYGVIRSVLKNMST